MKTNLYFMAAGLFTGLIFVILLLLLAGLRYALNQSGWPVARQQKVFWLTGLLMVGWLCFLGVLAQQSFFSNFNSLPPHIVLAVAPPFITIAMLANLRGVTNLLKFIPAGWLVYLQSFRVLVEIVLWMLFTAAIIPVQMTFEGLNFDILVGLTAPAAAYFLSGKTSSRRLGLLWNMAGLGLLLNIVIISVLSTPAPFRVFLNEPVNTVVAYLPFIWLPGFVVPVALALHVFSIKQLLSQKPENKAANPTATLPQVQQKTAVNKRKNG